MVMPVRRWCVTCGKGFEGSDCIAWPPLCESCGPPPEGIYRTSADLERAATAVRPARSWLLVKVLAPRCTREEGIQYLEQHDLEEGLQLIEDPSLMPTEKQRLLADLRRLRALEPKKPPPERPAILIAKAAFYGSALAGMVGVGFMLDGIARGARLIDRAINGAA